ncbi:hypothetical protein [Nitrobacter hamburgensis]|uniref:hypothetical protein n=1 Tax=Nitrobacter hamburgensis TaxID=912 RepID=UPI001FDAAE31|nr:hypothetical protein [Nitrobacter hamburgensis]
MLIRSAAASFAGHMALAAGLFFAEAHPFDYVSPEPIAVDIVSSKEIPSPAKEALPEPPQTSSTDTFDSPDDKPQADTADTKAATAKAQSTPAQASPASSETSLPAPSSSAPMPPASKQAALQPAPQPRPAPPPSYNAPEPDISVRYGVLLGLPVSGVGDGSGAAEATKADIPAMDTAQFRRHLKTCSKMPASVSPGDNIRIVLRVPFTTDGKIAAPPALIEASASAKGPALMKGAIAALVACQPYAMLPPDKYDEWKVLDLSFTPRDFVGG